MFEKKCFHALYLSWGSCQTLFVLKWWHIRKPTVWSPHLEHQQKPLSSPFCLLFAWGWRCFKISFSHQGVTTWPSLLPNRYSNASPSTEASDSQRSIGEAVSGEYSFCFSKADNISCTFLMASTSIAKKLFINVVKRHSWGELDDFCFFPPYETLYLMY